MNKTAMEVKEVWMNRAEGPINLCGQRRFTTLDQADATLLAWAYTAPRNGGYDKVDFKVTFIDGEEYIGRFDMKHPLAKNAEQLSFLSHMRAFVAFQAGERKPDWMKAEEYQKYLANENVEEAKEYLDNYLGRVGDAEPKKVTVGNVIVTTADSENPYTQGKIIGPLRVRALADAMVGLKLEGVTFWNAPCGGPAVKLYFPKASIDWTTCALPEGC